MHLHGNSPSSNKCMAQRYLLCAATVTTLLLASCKSNPVVKVELVSRPVDERSHEYAVVLKNNGRSPIIFEALPDAGYMHEACTPNTLLPMRILRRNDRDDRWEPRDTGVSGTKTSFKASPVPSARNVTVPPGATICAGWWHDYDAVKPTDTVRFVVCTSFAPTAQCFFSEPVELDKPPGNHR